MVSQVNARFDDSEFDDLRERKNGTTWKDVIRAGVEAVEDGESE